MTCGHIDVRGELGRPIYWMTCGEKRDSGGSRTALRTRLGWGKSFFCRMVGMGTIFPARTTDNSATAHCFYNVFPRKVAKDGLGMAGPGRAACAREKRNSGGCDRGQEHRQTYKFLFCIPLSSFPTHTLYCMHVPMRDCCRDKFRREIRVVSLFSFFSPNFFLDRVTRPVPFRRGALSLASSHLIPYTEKGRRWRTEGGRR